jgi:putative acetyltransferase
MAYAIRLFRSGDAEIVAGLTVAAIRKVGARAYSPAQVKAWASRHPGPGRFIQRSADGAHIWVAVDDADLPVAYALLESDAEQGGHLDMLYCHPNHTRRGLAQRLLDHAESYARSAGQTRIFTEASELARPAFERAGYTETHRRDFVIDGPDGAVSIHNYAMEKHLF